MKTSENLKQNAEGKYTWSFEHNLFKYPKVLVILLQIIFLACFVVFLLSMIVALNTHDVEPQSPMEVTGFSLLLFAFAAVPTIALYYLTVAIMGAKPVHEYEMDEQGISCRRGNANKNISFADLKKAKAKKNWCEIRTNKGIVYAGKDDFDEIYAFIKDHCNK